MTQSIDAARLSLKGAFRPVIIGVSAAKEVIRSRLYVPPPETIGEQVPCYMHYPADRDLGFFAQLVAERSVVKTANGKLYRGWEQLPGRANEAADLAVYSYAALYVLLHFGLKLNKRADKISLTVGLPAATSGLLAAHGNPAANILVLTSEQCKVSAAMPGDTAGPTVMVTGSGTKPVGQRRSLLRLETKLAGVAPNGSAGQSGPAK